MSESDENRKRIDESWKDTANKEKGSFDESLPPEEPVKVTFDLFVTGLMMEALIALGEVENPVTKTKSPSPAHAQFIIDTLAMLQDKTKDNLAKEETAMLESILYDLRMRFLNLSRKPR